MKISLYYPCKPLSINQGWGTGTAYYARYGLKGHNGIDFFAPDGTEVRATHDGVVTYAGLDGANGNLIVVRSKDVFDYEGEEVYFKTLYGHLKTGTYKVHATQEVKTGNLLALADNTGASSGSHLHFGLKPVLQGEEDWIWFNRYQENGYNGAIDPTPYFNGKFAKDMAEPPFQFTKDLSYGSVGGDVLKLQQFLVEHNFGFFTPTGFFGTKTTEAIKYLQQRAKITPAVGYFGPKTREYVNRFM
jgi:hypothetical protein